MDSLPLELHALIFELACTDDGTTARALALVSRYVQNVAAPYLFQSLAIAGVCQMEALLAHLDARPAHARRIRHLFLSDWTHKTTLTLRRGGALTEMERYEKEKALAARILQYAAPTLQTLALVAACPYTAPPLLGYLFALPMPRLEQLAIHGFYPFPQLHPSGGMPRLERLHLSGNRNPHGLLQLGALEAACPALTHLRVSELAGATPFARELHEAAIPRSRSEEESHALDLSPFPSALPARLRELVIEVRRPPEPAPNTNQHRHHHRPGVKRGTLGGHEKMMALLREVELRRAESRLEKMEVVEGDGVDMFAMLREGWLAGLQPRGQI